MTLEDDVLPIIGWVAAGLAFGATSYLTSNEGRLRPRQLAKTLVLYAAGALVAYSQGEQFGEQGILVGVALVTPIVNRAWDYLVTPQAGGSATKGRGIETGTFNN